MKLLGTKQVIAALKKSASGSLNPRAVVGYGTDYALAVHEKPAHHEVGQDNYLRQPYEDMQGGYKQRLAKRTQANRNEGKSYPDALASAVYEEGLDLIRASMKLVPVDTGRLRNSAFTQAPSGVKREKLEKTPLRPSKRNGGKR